MVLLQSALALAILAVCGFAPGFYFVRRLPWSGLEKLCGSVAFSLILIWLAAWGVYVFAPGVEAPAYALVSVCCAVAAFAARRDAGALFRSPRVRQALAGFGFVLVWTLVLLSMIRHYSGAGWRGDWLEHFQRSLFFLHHFPLNIQIFGNYLLPARPPAMNVFAAFVMAQAGDRFEVFQVTFAFLNLLLFLPCAMALPVLARPRRPGSVPLAAVFATSPVIMQNATYTWTKSLAAFFVILAILLYLKAWRKQDPVRMTAAFVALAMGMLVHYSAGPYIGFLALHYLLFVFWRRREKVRELAAIAGFSAILLATWFGWSMAAYGAHATLASNTSVTTSQRYQGRNLEKIAHNMVDSTIPILLRTPATTDAFEQPNHWGKVRDLAFIVYQLNLIFSMGALGGFAVLWLLLATLRKRLGRGRERAFWIGLVVWSVVVGIAVVGEGDPLGVAHLTLVPMAVLGMTLLASRFASSRAVAVVVIVGCAIDFSLGVFLHARIEHLENTPDRPVFLGLIFMQGQFRTGLVSEDSLSPMAWDNWMHKHEYQLADEWGKQVEGTHPGDPAYEAAKMTARQGLARMKAEDAALWEGWYERHGGETAFLGDQFGAGDATSAVLLLMFAGLMWKLIRPGKSRAAIVEKQAPVRKRVKR
ncbi:MAG TPA: hypothetical protein VMG35_29125 [Bryobacteraceae bacterium]|nr:hypothetical protein [Bryobacteraceae bacterium]